MTNKIKFLLKIYFKRFRLFLICIFNLIYNIFHHKIKKDLKYIFETEFEIHLINLDSRKDRLRSSVKELSKIGITNFIRLPAVFNENGALGCSQSHLKVLEKISRKKNYSIIIEDDIKFIGRLDALKKVVEDFLKNENISVLLLSATVRDVPRKYNDNLMQTSSGQTTAFYCFRNNFIENLTSSARKSVSMLELNPNKTNALDIVWKQLQIEFIFVIPANKIFIQRAGYSDIEKSFVSYL
jgi:hypothetical protein